MSKSARFIPSGGGGGGGSGHIEIGPNFGNPPEAVVRVSTRLSTVGIVIASGSPRVACALPSMGIAGLAAGSPRVSVAARADVTLFAGAATAVNDGPDNFTNPTNAQGVANATEATRAGSPTAAINATLRLTYTNMPSWLTSYTIEFVRLRFHFAQAGVVLGNGGVHVEYRTAAAGAWTTVLSTPNNNDNITSPLDQDITAIIGQDFTKLTDLETRIRATLPLASTATVRVDAIELDADFSKATL